MSVRNKCEQSELCNLEMKRMLYEFHLFWLRFYFIAHSAVSAACVGWELHESQKALERPGAIYCTFKSFTF